MSNTQQHRTIWRTGFFIIFLLAPILDIFRLDLTLGHFIIFGQNWQLGIRDVPADVAAFNLITRAFLPIALVIGVGGWISWRWGRLYCGWLCPHFSVVEMINSLMRRASGKTTLWLNKRMPPQQSDGTTVTPNKAWWPGVAVAVMFFSALWAITLLTYLLPPLEVWGNLFSGQLTRNQFIFITAGTILLTLEFTLARHLFCRFGCAVGLAQSLIWMANHKAMVIAFDRSRAAACASCDKSCEHACPMRLKPRQIKRKMFSCTQCQQCVQACERVSETAGRDNLLKLVDGDDALQVSERDFGHRPNVPDNCFAANDSVNHYIPLKQIED
ncbi:MAG: 4Fe-4S binding protein [Halioglobus sp.]